MADEPLDLSPPGRERRIRRRLFQESLSARLLVVVLAIVMASGILIHIPSILIYHRAYLEHRISDANIAVATLAALDYPTLDARRERALLDQVGATGIEVAPTPSEAGLRIGRLGTAKTVTDLHAHGYGGLFGETLTVLFSPTPRLLRIVGAPATQPERVLAVEFSDRHLKQELRSYSLHHMSLSLLISLIAAILVYASLERLMVGAVRRFTAHLVKFRQAPQADASIIQPTSHRRDEIGVMERELVRMQVELRAALTQQARFAALGRAVSQIHHDLKSILSTVSLTSERLARIDDPATGRIAKLLVGSVEKAIDLCAQTQDLARGETPVPAKTTFPLYPLVEEVGEMLRPSEHQVRWRNGIPPDFAVTADRERLYRVFLNLGKNALEALSPGGEIRITARQAAGQAVIDVCDTGPGLPEATLGSLFIPFAASGHAGGTGLGLATARDLLRAHGGELSLVETGPHGTCFRLTLPLFTP